WTAWAVFLFQHPKMDPHGGIRALIRLLVWVVPAFAFVLLVEGRPVLSRLGLRGGVLRGLGFGLAGFMVPVMFSLSSALFGSFRLAPPADLATWLNPILTAPFAEELVFRGLVFRLLRDRFNLL